MASQTYYFVVFDENADCQAFASKAKSLFNINFGSLYFPFGFYYWKNKDTGTVKSHAFNRFNSDSQGNSLQSLKQTLTTAMSDWKGIVEDIIVIKQEITTFGRGAPVTYVSSTGNSYICENNTIRRKPTYRVDKYTTSNFKYGI